MNALAKLAPTAAPVAKTIEQSRAEIYALFNAEQHGGLIWDALSPDERRIFCFAAGLKQGHINKPLADFNDMERHKLLRAIKAITSVGQKFATISLQEFK